MFKMCICFLCRIPFLHQQSAYCLIRHLLLGFAAGAATHQRLTTPPGPNSICLIFLHLQHICFNLTLSILEMRCNPVKPFSESASQARLFRLRSPRKQHLRCPFKGPTGQNPQTEHTRTDRLKNVSYFLPQSRSLRCQFIKCTLAPFSSKCNEALDE